MDVTPPPPPFFLSAAAPTETLAVAAVKFFSGGKLCRLLLYSPNGKRHPVVWQGLKRQHNSSFYTGPSEFSLSDTVLLSVILPPNSTSLKEGVGGFGF